MAGAEGVYQHDLGLWRGLGTSLCVSEYDVSIGGLWDGPGKEVCARSCWNAVWNHSLAGEEARGCFVVVLVLFGGEGRCYGKVGFK